MSDNVNQPDATLLGYELLEKIGAGGYGEVWSAVAPGGLRKAVKYIFGDQFDKRAASELHALEKIKSVRHPFLLSLERIEVVEGRLLVGPTGVFATASTSASSKASPASRERSCSAICPTRPRRSTTSATTRTSRTSTSSRKTSCWLRAT